MKIALHRLLGADSGPNKVQEIKTDVLGNLPVLHRDDGMVLYGPPLIASDHRKTQFEIVMNRPCSDNMSSAYSLYRASTLAEAEEKFNAFLQRLPVFVSIAKEVSTQSIISVCFVVEYLLNQLNFM